MAELGSRSYWEEWRRVRCRTLVVLGENGIFPAEQREQILSQLRGANLAVIRGAGHDVHLDAPQEWVRALSDIQNG